MIALVHNYEKITGRQAVYLGEYKALDGKNPVGVIPYFTEKSKTDIYTLMNQGFCQDLNLESLALSDEMIQAWNLNNKKLFNQLRTVELIRIEKEMLESVGIEVKVNITDI